MAVTPTTAGLYLAHFWAAFLPSKRPFLASYFPFLSLWLRGGAAETEVEELPTMVWGLRNMSLLIFNKESHSFLDGVRLYLGPLCLHGGGSHTRQGGRAEAKGCWAEPCLHFCLHPLSVTWFRRGQAGIKKGQSLTWGSSLNADYMGCVCWVGEHFSSGNWVSGLLLLAVSGQGQA